MLFYFYPGPLKVMYLGGKKLFFIHSAKKKGQAYPCLALFRFQYIVLNYPFLFLVISKSIRSLSTSSFGSHDLVSISSIPPL